MTELKKISFGFSKIQKKSNQSTSKSNEVRGVEYITSFDGMSKPDTKSELIIPLQNNYSVEERILEKRRKKAMSEAAHTENKSPARSTISENGSLEMQAIQEILNDTKKALNGVSSNIEIPLAGTLDGISALDEEPDYDEIPVESFGEAMLKGMGWRPGAGIGKKQKVVEPVEVKVRIKNLGLGAEPCPEQK